MARPRDPLNTPIRRRSRFKPESEFERLLKRRYGPSLPEVIDQQNEMEERAAKLHLLRHRLGLSDTKEGWEAVADHLTTTRYRGFETAFADERSPAHRPRQISPELLMALLADYVAEWGKRDHPKRAQNSILLFLRNSPRYRRRWGGKPDSTLRGYLTAAKRWAESLSEPEFEDLLDRLPEYGIDAFTAANDFVPRQLPSGLHNRAKKSAE